LHDHARPATAPHRRVGCRARLLRAVSNIAA
jgi:hypothetical protein